MKYQSLSSPEPLWRWIAPHAIALDGFLWHTPAFCLTDECFKDFPFSRIIELRGTRESGVASSAERDWNVHVSPEIGPHPALSEIHAKVITFDYAMRRGKVRIKVRRALLYYALRRFGLDTDPGSRRPHDQQIVLLNRDEILGPCKPAGKQ